MKQMNEYWNADKIDDAWEFPGGVCPVCGHSPLKVRVLIHTDSNWYQPKWACDKCGNTKNLLKSKKVDAKRDPHISNWATAVLDRDRACVICGETRNLDAHHLIPVSKQPTLQFKLSNGITLCRRCHKLVHDGVLWPEQYK